MFAHKEFFCLKYMTGINKMDTILHIFVRHDIILKIMFFIFIFLYKNTIVNNLQVNIAAQSHITR